MHETEINFDPELTRKIFRKYFAYQKRRALKKIPGKLIAGISLALMLVGILTGMYFWLYLGTGVLAVLIAFLLVFLLRFKTAMQSFETQLEKNKHAYAGLKFGFNNTEIIRQTKNTRQTIQWEAIAWYEENEGDIYLYNSTNGLFDIISTSLIGPDNYKEFLALLVEKHEN